MCLTPVNAVYLHVIIFEKLAFSFDSFVQKYYYYITDDTF